MKRLIAALLLLVSLCQVGWTQGDVDPLDCWPNWRGPEYTGVAPRGNPPTEWGPDSNIAWKCEIPGRGSATPIVWGDRVFIATAVETDRQRENVGDLADQEQSQQGRRGRRRSPQPTNYYQFQLLAVDLESGNVVWQKTATEQVPNEAGHPTNTFASASPVTDGKHIYVSFGSYGIYCYTMDGEQVWSRDLGDMQTRAGFGEGASPALYGDTLVVNWDHEGQSFVTALDAATGEPLWRQDRDERTTWVTPRIVQAAGKTQVIVNAENRTRSYELETGDLIWECGGQVGNPIPTPVVYDNMVICMSGYRGAAIYAIPLDATGDITGSETVLWHADKAAPYVPSPLLYGRRLYFTKSNNGILSMVDVRTGEFIIDQQRLGDISSIYASPVGAAGRVYIVGRDGTTMVLRDSDAFEVLAVNRLDEPVDASPAIVAGKMLIRAEKHLFCLGE